MDDHFTNKDLKELQALPFEYKIARSIERIENFHKLTDGKIYVAFSGGRDSTVLLHLVRSVFPNTQAVFMNTGLEYPEIVRFVKVTDNVKWLHPEKKFKKVLEEDGYPVISKRIARIIKDFQNASEKNSKTREGYLIKKNKYYLPERWRFLLNAPFKISDSCCWHLKKSPAKKFSKESGLYPITGIMAEEGGPREKNYMKYGCIINTEKNKMLRPLGFWTKKDTTKYIEKNNVDICPIYENPYIDRTGCIYCMFGVANEKYPNRFQLLKETHPAQYRYCMEKLGLNRILDYLGVPY